MRAAQAEHVKLKNAAARREPFSAAELPSVRPTKIECDLFAIDGLTK
jgi:hypothetical protein